MKPILSSMALVAVLAYVPGHLAAQQQQQQPTKPQQGQQVQAQRSQPHVGPPIRQSWTSDRVNLRVGDIVTILVDEQTRASADRDESATRQHQRNLGLQGGTGLTTQGGTLRTQNDIQERNQGGSTRTQNFTAQISTRVVQVGPGGLLRVEGTKEVKIGKHDQKVIVRGWVRPEDVSMDNTVYSWRVANAEILYTSDGSLVKAGGLWSKLLDLIIP